MSAGPYAEGAVDWTGENPGLYLKDDPAGPWLSLASLFRINWSPHGNGNALVLLEDPSGTRPGAVNLCLTDNEPMARWLVAGFLSHFAAFRDRPLLAALECRPLEHLARSGDGLHRHVESARGGGVAVELRWERLGTPYAVDFPPSLTATGRHRMYSLFMDSNEAAILLDGRTLPGRVMPRPVAGRESRSAFLAFSETWVRA